jgi:hypothetical protein
MEMISSLFTKSHTGNAIKRDINTFDIKSNTYNIICKNDKCKKTVENINMIVQNLSNNKLFDMLEPDIKKLIVKYKKHLVLR